MVTDVHRAEPWKNARLLTRDSWSLPSLTEEACRRGLPGAVSLGGGQDWATGWGGG